MQSIITIYMISVVCYQDKYQLNSRLTDQLLHNSLGKECPAAFWNRLSQLIITSNAFCKERAGTFLTSLAAVTGTVFIYVAFSKLMINSM